MTMQKKQRRKLSKEEQAKIWIKTIYPQLLKQKELIDKGLATPELEQQHLEDLKRYCEALTLIFPDLQKVKIPWKKVTK